MTMTRGKKEKKQAKHHELRPELCSEFFDETVKNVSSSLVSKDLARGFIQTCRWLAGSLPFEFREIRILFHDKQPVRVEYTVSVPLAATKKDRYEARKARQSFEEALDRLEAAKGVGLHPRAYADCFGVLFSVLLRHNPMKFGELILTFRNGKPYELVQREVSRGFEDSDDESMGQSMYPPR